MTQPPLATGHRRIKIRAPIRFEMRRIGQFTEILKFPLALGAELASFHRSVQLNDGESGVTGVTPHGLKVVPMNTGLMHNVPPFRRLQAQKMLKPLNFICQAPQAQVVSVVGDFNQWQPNSHPLKKAFDGSWQGSVPLPHGHHRYAFLVDGVITLDPNGKGVSRDDAGNRVSLISVS